MLRRLSDGSIAAGVHDVLVILHNGKTGTYHVCHFAPDYSIQGKIRLTSDSLHKEGNSTLEGAQQHIDELLHDLPDGPLEFLPGNVLRESAIPWDGNLPVIWVVQDWKQDGIDGVFTAPV